MNHAQSGEGDVYLYMNLFGKIVCCGCGLLESAGPGSDPVFDTQWAASLHLAYHVEEGDAVPDRAFKLLTTEM